MFLVQYYLNHFLIYLKVSITAASCVACFLLGLPCASSSGQYILDLMDTYGAGFAVLWIGIWELIGLMWIYGFKNVSKDIELMLGHEPCWFWKLCWGFISPIFLVVVFILAIVSWSNPQYSNVSTSKPTSFNSYMVPRR